MNVDLDGMAVMGDKRVDVIQAAPGMNVPVVRVRAYAVMGDVKVIGDSQAQPVQRGFAAWREHWRRLHGEDWRALNRQVLRETRELGRQARELGRQTRGEGRGNRWGY